MRRAGAVLAIGAVLGACEGDGADAARDAAAAPAADGAPATTDAASADGTSPPVDGAPSLPRTWRAERVLSRDDGLRGPDGLIVEGGARLFLANEVGGNVLVVDVDRRTTEVRLPAGAGGLRNPEEVAVGPNGALYVSDDAAVAVFRSAPGAPLEAVLDRDDGLVSPEGIAVGADGTLFVADEKAHVLMSLRPGAREAVTLATEEDGVFAPESLAVGRDGTLYATDDRRGGVLAVDPEGRPRQFLDADTLALPESVAVDVHGDLWFADNGGAATVQRFSTAGERLEVIEVPVATGALAGLAVLADGRVVVSVSQRDVADEIWVLTPEVSR